MAEIAAAHSMQHAEPITSQADVLPAMSFPAILRNPKAAIPPSLQAGRDADDRRHVAMLKSRYDQEGKRWVRRKENAIFSNNPHIVKASRSDMALDIPAARATFPAPLPPYLPRTVSAPSSTQPRIDPSSSNSGRFSMSLKGMRRELRSFGLRAQILVQEVEQELVDWLAGGVILYPETNATDARSPENGRTIGGTRSIFEVSRTPLKLTWSITDDAFARYVVHCCARYHQVVSFSKDADGARLTHLLRPNVTRPDFVAKASLNTPPISDLEHLSQASENDSDLESSVVVIREEDAQSDTSSYVNVRRSTLPSIVPHAMSPLMEAGRELEGDAAYADDDASSVDISLEDLAISTASLPPATGSTPPLTALARLSLIDKPSTATSPGRGHSRAESSPSRSPVRIPMKGRRLKTRAVVSRPKSFYEFLYG